MVYLPPLSRQQLTRRFVWLALLLLLSSCAAPNTTNKQTQGGITVSIPSCRQFPCTTSPIPTVPGDFQGIRQFIDTWNDVHLFQTFDYNISDPLPLARRYDFVWGAELGHVAAFRSSNPDILLSYYIPFDRDWGVFPDSNTRHDLAYWQTAHPDWILYKCDRVTPAYTSGYPNVPLDFTNPAVVSWQVETYALPASEHGYDAIAADDVILPNFYGACGIYKNNQWAQRYTGQVDDPQWRADIITWLKRMQQSLHHLRHPMALIPNFYAGNLSLSNPQVQQIVKYSDGLLDEDGFTDLGRGDITDNAWLQRVQFIESVQGQHKPYYIINKLPSDGRGGIQWAIASYLMAKEHLSSLFISPPNKGYGTFYLYDEYNIQIGTPSGPMYQMQNVYLRDYSHGLSIVNPSATNTYTVTLNAQVSYVDLYSNPVAQTITLAPHSGLVLLLRS